MAANEFSEEARQKLLSVSAATLTTVLFKRGLRNTFIGGLTPLNPAVCRMVGPAYTLRYIPAREDLDHLDVFVQERVMDGATIFGLYPPAAGAKEAFRTWRAARARSQGRPS
jgi:regulator of RNase E activity RraA